MASINPMGRMTAHRNHTVANEITTESTGSRITHTMTVDIRTQASVAAKAVTRVSCQGSHHHQSTTLPGQEVYASHIPWGADLHWT